MTPRFSIENYQVVFCLELIYSHQIKYTYSICSEDNGSWEKVSTRTPNSTIWSRCKQIDSNQTTTSYIQLPKWTITSLLQLNTHSNQPRRI